MKRDVNLKRLHRLTGFLMMVGRWFIPFGVGVMLLARLGPVFEGGTTALVKGASLTGLPMTVQLVMMVWSFAICLVVFINCLRGRFDLLLMGTAFLALKMACYPAAVAMYDKRWDPWDIWIAFFVFAASFPVAVYCFRSK